MVKVNYGWVNRQDALYEKSPFMAHEDRMYPFPAYDPEDPDERSRNVAGFITIGLGEALRFIIDRVKVHKPCNDCFARLPGRRSFAQIWDDPDVWIHYNGRSTSYGFSRPASKEIAVCFKSFMSSVAAPGKPNSMQVAATIVHELAHLNGAEGDPRKRDNSAENSLRFCLLTQMFKPDVFGAIDNQVKENSDRASATA